MGTLPNATNDFYLESNWPTGKLPVVCTRFGSNAAIRYTFAIFARISFPVFLGQQRSKTQQIIKKPGARPGF